MSDMLPGMPLAPSDIRICRIDDGEPTPDPPEPPEPAKPPRLVWLALATCPHCNYKTGRYCSSHDIRPRRG